MESKPFNLIDEPWILVRYCDGKIREVSLTTLFADMREIHEIVGELPTQAFAVFRTILAIVYRALEVETADEWFEWYRDPAAAQETISDYLNHFHDRFDLRHPKRPFYQVAEVDWSKTQKNGLSSLIGDYPNRDRKDWFITRRLHHNSKITWSEAARWLIYIQQYDGAGKHSVIWNKNGKKISESPTAKTYLGNKDAIYIERSNLFETFMFNLLPSEELGTNYENLNDVPSWESNRPYRLEEKSEDASPVGIASLLSWQARNVAFTGDDDFIHRAIVSSRLPKMTSNPLFEPMFSFSWNKKDGSYKPHTFEYTAPVCRGLSAMLAQLPNDEQIAYKSVEYSKYRQALVLGWAGKITERLGTYNPLLAIRIVGIRFVGGGQKQGSIDNILDERLELPTSILNNTRPELTLTVRDGLELTEKIASQIHSLMCNISEKQKISPISAKERARNAKQKFYASIDRDFRQWLRNVSSREDVESWKAQLLTHAWEAETTIANSISSTKIFDTARYIKDYRYEVRKILGATSSYKKRNEVEEWAPMLNLSID